MLWVVDIGLVTCQAGRWRLRYILLALRSQFCSQHDDKNGNTLERKRLVPRKSSVQDQNWFKGVAVDATALTGMNRPGILEAQG